MNLSEVFIRRPVATTLVILGCIGFGTMAYRVLPVADLPNVDFPTIQVNASLPGASPETMASAVALPLEKQFATIAGVTSISSSSVQGSTSITLQFDLTRNIDAAAQDVQSQIARTARSLPPQMPAPPSYQKVNPADFPVSILVLESDTLPLSALDEYAQSTIAQRLSMINGVAQVNVMGSQKYAVRIDIDPRALAAKGIGIDEVATAVQNANVNVPTGSIQGSEQQYVVQTNGQLMRAAAFGPTIISYRNGTPVRLDEIAHVFDGVENDKSANWANDKRAIVLMVQKQPGSNIVSIADALQAMLPNIREHLPATLIPSLALPVSIVFTFAIMYMLGYSVNNLTLMALTLAVGFVVDDAIVMLENIVRHMEMGKSGWQASLDGSREVAFTILSMTLSLATVFVPVLFMGGIVGRLLHEFSVTIAAAILVSGFVSISLTPMMCSRFLKNPHGQRHGAIYNAFERAFDLWRNVYDWTLRQALRFHVVTAAVSIILMVATVDLFMRIPKG